MKRGLFVGLFLFVLALILVFAQRLYGPNPTRSVGLSPRSAQSESCCRPVTAEAQQFRFASPDAEAAFQRALAAAAQRDWDTAHAELEVAQADDPLNPFILYNLGVAHAKGGALLPAMAWFRAYVAVQSSPTHRVPGMDQRTAVLADIKRLEIAVETQIDDLASLARSIADLIPDSWERVYALEGLAWNRALLGDLSGATRLLDEIGKKIEPRFFEAYGAHLALTGDLDEARAVLKTVFGDFDTVWAEWAHYLASQGDFTRAEEAARKITSNDYRESVIRTLEQDREGEQELLRSVKGDPRLLEIKLRVRFARDVSTHERAPMEPPWWPTSIVAFPETTLQRLAEALEEDQIKLRALIDHIASAARILSATLDEYRNIDRRFSR